MRFLIALAVILAALGGLSLCTVRPGPVAISAGDASAALTTALTIPVRGVPREALRDSWHEPREAGARAHEATDIPAPRATPVIAAMPGRVEKLFASERGGTTIYIRSDDGGWTTYYAHLAGYAPGLAEGQRVERGAVIGFVGDSGDAGAGNTHLHFALARMRPGERWWQGTPVNPYPLLAGRPAPR